MFSYSCNLSVFKHYYAVCVFDCPDSLRNNNFVASFCLFSKSIAQSLISTIIKCGKESSKKHIFQVSYKPPLQLKASASALRKRLCLPVLSRWPFIRHPVNKLACLRNVNSLINKVPVSAALSFSFAA